MKMWLFVRLRTLAKRLEGCANVWRHGNTSARFRLGVLTAKGDESPTEVNMVPCQRHNLLESLTELVAVKSTGQRCGFAT